MKRKVALVGSNGQLGSDLTKVLSYDQDIDLSILTHHEIEITDEDSIKKTLDQISPDLIINTAAYNAVDNAEIEPEKAYLINALAVKYLSQYSAEKNIILAHISTDYVFGLDEKRDSAYRESDLPGPVNAYGLSKLAGEYFMQYLMRRYFIIRSSGLFGIVGSAEKGGNFVDTIIRKGKETQQVKVVDDQILTPTYTLDLAKQIALLTKTANFGLYHATADGQCSWYEFTKAIFELTNLQTELIPVSSQEFPLPARRPHYSVLENENIKKLGINVMRDWKEGLKDYLKEKNYTRS